MTYGGGGRERTGGDNEIDLKTPNGIIASCLSIIPETLSRTLHGFAKQGILRLDGQRVIMFDADALRSIAEPL